MVLYIAPSIKSQEEKYRTSMWKQRHHITALGLERWQGYRIEVNWWRKYATKIWLIRLVELKYNKQKYMKHMKSKDILWYFLLSLLIHTTLQMNWWLFQIIGLVGKKLDMNGEGRQSKLSFATAYCWMDSMDDKQNLDDLLAMLSLGFQYQHHKLLYIHDP